MARRSGETPAPTGHGQHVHTRNGQGLTPVMLLLRDVDLFVSVTMGRDYRPVDVLQELLRHNVDTDLLDYEGRSAISYLSEVTSPLRWQLTDALERWAPPPDAHGEASCDLCLDTKPSLHDAAPAGVYSSAIPKENSMKLRSDGISSDILEETLDPAADLGAQPDIQEEIAFHEIENFAQMQERKGNPWHRQWFTDPSTPEHLTFPSAIKRHPSLPPIHMKAGEEVSKLEKLGLGYLVQESYSEPNISKCYSTPNTLYDIKSIKGHIWQRLGSAELSRDSKTFPPISHSPRSPMRAKLKPLLESGCSNTKTNKSSMAQSSANRIGVRGEGLTYEHNLEKSLQNLEDKPLPGDLLQINLDGSLCSKNQQGHRDDCSSKTAEDGSTGSRRKDSAEERETARRHANCRDPKPPLHTNGKTQKNCKETGTSLHIEQIQLHGHGDGLGKSRLSEIEKEELSDTRKDEKLEIHDKSKGTEQNLRTSTPTNEDTKRKVEPKNMDSSRTPKTSHIPFVKITFSEQEPMREMSYSPGKPFFTKRKPKPGSLLHNVNHSFNIHAQKENEKTPKTRKGRSMSAQDNTKYQRPLSYSNRTHGKSLPLPPLVNSSVPSPSKVSKKVARSAQGSTDRSIHRSHTQLSLCSQKRMNSPRNTPILPTSKSSCDFQAIEYSDMFVEITSQQGNGPVIYQMFPPTVYVNIPNSSRKTSSASTTKSCSSKGSCAGSSRNSSARSKRPKLKSKKNPSATSQRRRNSLSKQEGTEKGENKTENTVIISGVDWEIKTQKQDGDITEFPVNGMIEVIAEHHNFELTTINEASLENSTTIKGTIKEALKMLSELKRRSSNVGPNNPENVDQDLLRQDSDMGQCVQEDIGFTKHSSNGETCNVQDPKTGSTSAPSQDRNATETPSQFQQDEALEDWVLDDNQKGDSVEPTYNREDTFSTTQNIQRSFSPGGSEYLTAQLYACLEKLISTDEEFSESEDGEDGIQGIHVSESQNVGEHLNPSNIQQGDVPRRTNVSRNQDVTPSPSTSTGITEANMGAEVNPSQNSHCGNEGDGRRSDLPAHEGLDKERRFSHQQKRIIQEVSANPSVSDHKSHTDPTANQSGLHHNESATHWIKGEVLGKGAYGTVYRGLTSQGELIAAKQVILHGSDPELAEKEYKKLQEEVDLLKTLKHPNIVGYLGTSFEDPVVTIFMEFVPGGSISSVIRHFGPLREVVISKYTSHILQGISYLHRNRVVHRDIKGNNVMLMPNGVIKLIDFGCAKRLNGLSMNGTPGEMLHSMRGTPYWMAPEVINESGHGEKSDIWSIGCTVYEMAIGKPPLAEMERMAAIFYIGIEKGLMPTLPDHFSRIAREFVNLCLTRDQDKRPSAEQLIQHTFVRSIS
ncbi:mitogen-activated protein kinase kinase kinase 19-like isoform X2 [Hyla sarda]|uniref:mitogen-activated protein kinase kinase kinase 19-like isoform X2 n=1 Tax=Hyla sarda TaxID=327740 RepID=UPI0024C25DCB|nr:mitogen-activated protein kinase kinase kinase 19-like isoform X2 [Hyla sarda]